MDKWADYLISEASYDHDHLIYVALRHQDTDKGITKGKPIDRLTISSDIKNGLVYITIFSGKDSWKKGHKIQTFSIGGNPYLRIDENKVKLDYLGDLPDTSIAKPEPLKELEFQPESTPESISEPEDESTSEQLEQLEQLEKQIQEFESQQSITESTSSSRGSLPKGFTKELPQEPTLELEEEATPEQLTQLDDLQQQINELEDVLSAQLNPSSDEPTPEQLSRVKKLEKEIEKLESIDIENEIIQTLQKQNDKLDNIEKKLHGSTTKKDISESDFPQAYCVKCKTKRKIKNPKETTMKNGRAAIKGFCSVCNCKVFRIGKIKK